MSIKSLVAALAVCVSMVTVAADPMGSQSAVEQGKWCNDFPAARAYADANNIPMLVFWANPGCGQCEKLEKACHQADFLAWQADRKLVMVFAYGKTATEQKAAYEWIKSVARLKDYPFVGVYWNKNKQYETVSSVFVGRSGKMPVTSGSLQKQLMDSVDQLTAGWDPSGVTPEPTPEDTCTVTFVVDSSKATYKGNLVQEVVVGTAATAPSVAAKSGWKFTGWDKSFNRVSLDMTVTAQFMEEEEDVRPEAYGKVHQLTALVINRDTETYVGTATISLGKLSKTRNTVKVTAKLALFSGKSDTASDTVHVEPDGSMQGSLEFDKLNGAMSFTVSYSKGAYLFETEGKTYEIEQSDSVVGGRLDTTELKFFAEVGGLKVADGYEILADIPIPNNEPVYVKNGTKFSFDGVPTIKYQKPRGAKQYELTGLDDEEKTNLSGLKLTYKSSTGIFSGSFKVYASNAGSIAAGKKPTLRKYTATVKGVILDGYGYGEVTVKVGKVVYMGMCKLLK